MNELREELESSLKKSSGSWTLAPLVLFVTAILLFGVYVGNLLFGANSLEVLLKLKARENELERRVERLRESNAKLQKEYFELKGLEPQ